MKRLKFNIKQAREYRGLTQKQMAKRLGVVLATYRKYEWGQSEMKIGTAKKFADIVKIPFNQLIFYSRAS